MKHTVTIPPAYRGSKAVNTIIEQLSRRGGYSFATPLTHENLVFEGPDGFDYQRIVDSLIAAARATTRLR
jgi:hypothetical protein